MKSFKLLFWRNWGRYDLWMDTEGNGSSGLTNVLLIEWIALFWCAHQREIRGTFFGWGYGTHQVSREGDLGAVKKYAEDASRSGWRLTGVWCLNSANAFIHLISRPWGGNSE